LQKKDSGKIFIVGTPIGNLGDITLRALDTLKSVDVVVAEDTRRTLKLLNYYEIKKPLVSYHKHNEKKRSVELIEMLKSGKDIAVVSDAGMPGISDPGRELIKKAWEEGIGIEVVPGVSAVTAALSITGFESTPFIFYGFPPARGKERKRFFKELGGEKLTIVLFESPARFRKTLKDILEHLGNRRIVVARELTKIHEEIFRGTVEEAIARWQGDVKGEITIIVEGKSDAEKAKGSEESAFSDMRRDLEELIDSGLSTRDAAKEISRRYCISRSAAYKEALKIIGEKQ